MHCLLGHLTAQQEIAIENLPKLQKHLRGNNRCSEFGLMCDGSNQADSSVRITDISSFLIITNVHRLLFHPTSPAPVAPVLPLDMV